MVKSLAYGRLVGLLICLMLVPVATVKAERTPGTTDLRILIDISGSMLETDPRNFRTPAINLLIDSLPTDSQAGIWSFGRYVNLLVDHDSVTPQWRDNARSRVSELRAIAQRTNLGAALDDAAYDFGYSTYSPPTDVVLITDGQVDIAPNDGVNRIERDRILDSVIPRYAEAGARIHSLALTDAADTGLLEQLSLQTGGVFERVESAEDIRGFVLRVLDSVSPGNELPLDEAGFDIDDQVSEVTALVLHEDGRIALRGPDGDQSSALDPGAQQWRVGDGYTLVTVPDPEPGRWQLEGAVETGSRVSVVSDLNLRWQRPRESVVVRNLPLILELNAVDQSGEPVSAELTGVMEPSLTINGESVDGLRWQDQQLRAQLPNRFSEGPLELEVGVDAGTFQRVVRRTVQNQPALSSEVLVVDGGYQWRLYPSHRSLDVAGPGLEARIEAPDGTRTEAFTRHPSGYFRIDIPSDAAPGTYRLTAEGQLVINDQSLSDLGVAPVTLSLPVEGDQPRIMNPASAPEPAGPEPEPAEPPAAFEKEPMPEFEEITADVTVAPPQPEPAASADVPAVPEQDGLPWMTYLLYSIPGVIVLLGFFAVYRLLEKRGNGEGDDVLAEPRLDQDGLDDIAELDRAAGIGTGEPDYSMDEGEAPLVDEVVSEEEDEPPTPDRTEAPRADLEDSLDTSLLDQEDDLGDLDDQAGDEGDNPDEDLFDISNIDEGLADLDDLSLDEDDPFATDDDEDEDKDKDKGKDKDKDDRDR